MKILNVTRDFVEVLWADDNEIEMIPIAEFKAKYPKQLRSWIEDQIDFRNDDRL